MPQWAPCLPVAFMAAFSGPEEQRPTPTDMVILAFLRQFARRADSCRVRHKVLADAAGISIPTVRRALKHLAQLGWISTSGDVGESCTYTLKGGCMGLEGAATISEEQIERFLKHRQCQP